ncbi:MAG: hypothetical protein HXY23_05480, partial [Parvularculaceae bacterium]|nr:hypothetical protein [Parvularculaceae bacterium]
MRKQLMIAAAAVLAVGCTTNPYTGEKWEDSFEDWALNLVRDPNTGEMYTMPYMSVQTFWVYNKRIFAEAGIT